VVLRSGNVEQVGSPLELYLNPANDFVAGFIGSPQMNFINCEVMAVSADMLRLRLPCGLETDMPATTANVRAGDNLKLGIRPEHVLEDASGELVICVDVDVVEHLGGSTFVYADYAGDISMTLQVGGLSDINGKDKREISFNRHYCHLFNEAGKSIGLRKDARELKAAEQRLPMAG
jgi:ABC-type sugar transport system ATPase subunit